jgi:hypothetical protein
VFDRQNKHSMNLKKSKPLLSLTLLVVMAYLLHKITKRFENRCCRIPVFNRSALFIVFRYVYFDIHCITKSEKSFDNVECLSFRNDYQNGFLLFDFKTYLAHYNI